MTESENHEPLLEKVLRRDPSEKQKNLNEFIDRCVELTLEILIRLYDRNQTFTKFRKKNDCTIILCRLSTQLD